MTKDPQDKALLNVVLEAAVDAIIVADSAGTIKRVNPAACRLFQYQAEEIIGQHVNMLMPSAFAEAHDKYMSQYMQTGKKQIIGIGRDVEGQRKD